jgi:C4-dicarboxylate transporter DctM subunit
MAILLFVVFLILLVINVPIAIGLAMSAVIVLAASSEIPLVMLPQKMFAAMDSFPLMAAPFFILAGKLMEHGGISERLVQFANSLVGRIRGGLAHVSIIACMFFAAVSGSATATTAAVGGIMIPAMVRAGYDRPFSTAVQSVAGTTGILIPPSVPMVLYGVSAGASISTLFLAGIVPGILVGLSLMAVAYLLSRSRGYRTDDQKVSLREIGRRFVRSFPAIFMPVIILGGIYSGLFTPTEASVVAVVYGLVVGLFVYKELDLKKLRGIFVSSAETTSVILLMIGTAALFGMVLTREQVPQSVAEWLASANLSSIEVLLLVNLLLLLVGTFMEVIAAIIILTPILLPVMTGIGVDPIHFGVIMITNLAIGLITPPVGLSLYVGSQVGNVRFEKLVRAVFPFLWIMIVDVLLVTFLPGLTLIGD